MNVDTLSTKTDRSMPDVAQNLLVQHQAPLDWVGMSEVDVPVQILDQQGGSWRVRACATALVNLSDADAKGIHMSRLYLHLQEQLSQPLTPRVLGQLLDLFRQSHKGISDAAQVKLEFECMLERPALKSSHRGWRSYPVQITATDRQGIRSLELALTITYSSTCPCSAALSRQLNQKQFHNDFMGKELRFEEVSEWLASPRGMSATPHGQRSTAEVRLTLHPDQDNFLLSEWIDLLECALQTPVQAAVKREDEQEFARLNASNLMFCEDAARRLHHVLDRQPELADFWIRATHYESLHPHNAVSVASKRRPPR